MVTRMADPIITLTTDFGEDSPYVAAMKGVILALNPQARVVDLGHQIPAQDLRYAAFFLKSALPYFPAGVIHTVVVDPGVGSDRAILYVECGGHRLLVPDNGCWTELPGAHSSAVRVIRLTEEAYWRRPVSATFHGRDIFAPVAAHLSLGVPPERLGTPAGDWVRLAIAPPRRDGDGWVGEVVFVDHFGNLITNIPGEALAALPAGRVEVQVGERLLRPLRVRTYAEAVGADVVALVSSSGMLEVAVPNGSAARLLGARPGTGVRLLDGSVAGPGG